MTRAKLTNMRKGGLFDPELKERPVLIVGTRSRGERILVIPGSGSSPSYRYTKTLHPSQYPFLRKPSTFLCDHMQYQRDDELAYPLGFVTMEDLDMIISLADAAIQD